jgi:hypothetical protein
MLRRCPSRFGTHNCSQIEGHSGIHYCPCVDGKTQRWKTGDKAPLEAYDPKRIEAVHVLELRKAGYIK